MDSRLTTDRNDPDLGIGGDSGPGPQNKKYLILSKEERSKGFVRPLRYSYLHSSCGVVTRMGQELSETYAREPGFYGYTYCVGCQRHLPVGQFTWDGTTERVGS